jgi:hypothetical protein
VSSRAIDQEYFIIRAGLNGMRAVLSTVWSVLACMCQKFGAKVIRWNAQSAFTSMVLPRS